MALYDKPPPFPPQSTSPEEKAEEFGGGELCSSLEAWRNLLFYVGSCLRYISVTYSRRLELIGEDWKAIQESCGFFPHFRGGGLSVSAPLCESLCQMPPGGQQRQ